MNKMLKKSNSFLKATNKFQITKTLEESDTKFSKLETGSWCLPNPCWLPFCPLIPCFYKPLCCCYPCIPCI